MPAVDLREMHCCLRQLETSRMMAYDGTEQLFASIPVDAVDLLVLGPDISPTAVTRITRWSRRHWPRCTTVVLGQAGDGRQERMARQSGAFYFASPMTSLLWNAVLEGAAASRSVRLAHLKSA